jgi:hypothetical protein
MTGESSGNTALTDEFPGNQNPQVSLNPPDDTVPAMGNPAENDIEIDPVMTIPPAEQLT